jgi:hypothetical protein
MAREQTQTQNHEQNYTNYEQIGPDVQNLVPQPTCV